MEDQLENVRELCLLIGSASNRETIEQIAEGYRRLEPVREAAGRERGRERRVTEDRVRRGADRAGLSVWRFVRGMAGHRQQGATHAARWESHSGTCIAPGAPPAFTDLALGQVASGQIP